MCGHPGVDDSDFLTQEEGLTRGKEGKILAGLGGTPSLEGIEITEVVGLQDHGHVAPEEPFGGVAMDFVVLPEE